MTNEQAIEVLQSLRRKFLPSMKVEKEAIDMAIEALKNERPQEAADLCETCRYGDTCGHSDKCVSFAKHTICWKYRKEGGRQ